MLNLEPNDPGLDQDLDDLVDDIFSCIELEDRPRNSLWDMCSACLEISESLRSFKVLAKDIKNDDKHFDYMLHKSYLFSLGHIKHNRDLPEKYREKANCLRTLAHYIAEKFEEEIFSKNNNVEFFSAKTIETLEVMYRECVLLLVGEIGRWDIKEQLSSFSEDNLPAYIKHILDHKGEKDNKDTQDIVPFFMEVCKKFILQAA